MFEDWLENHERGGHPWEICRGGNSTHISLYVCKNDQGFYFSDETYYERAAARLDTALEKGWITKEDKNIISRYLLEKDSIGTDLYVSFHYNRIYYY